MRYSVLLHSLWAVGFICWILSGLCPQAVQAASFYEYPNLAVLPYANKAAVSRELSLADASLVSEFVIEKLIDSGRFNVMERDVLMEIMQEHNFSMSGMVDPSTAPQIGRIAGISYFVAGSVTGLSSKVSGASYENSVVGSAGGNKNTVIANITMRFIDIETGRIVMAVSGTGESASTNMEFKLNQTKTDTIETTGYDEYTEEEYIMEGEESSTTTHTIKIGTQEFSQVQVRNALYKAVDDAIFNKNFGLLAKMDGKSKRRKV